MRPKTAPTLEELVKTVEQAKADLGQANQRATGALRDREAAHMRLLEAQADLDVALGRPSHG